MENTQQKVNDEVARTIGNQAIELIALRVENAALREEIEKLKPLEGS